MRLMDSNYLLNFKLNFQINTKFFQDSLNKMLTCL